jgi:hypothetical protein
MLDTRLIIVGVDLEWKWYKTVSNCWIENKFNYSKELLVYENNDLFPSNNVG